MKNGKPGDAVQTPFGRGVLIRPVVLGNAWIVEVAGQKYIVTLAQIERLEADDAD